MIQLGNQVRDIVTGLEGIATSCITYLNGCVQYCVKPPMKDGKIEEGQYIDVQQLEVTGDGIIAKIQPNPTGGPQRDAPRGDGYRG